MRLAGAAGARPALLAGIGAGAAMASAIAFTRPFSWQADLVTTLGIVITLVGPAAAARRGFRRRTSAAGVTRRAATVWGTAAGAILAFELGALFSLPRRTHPTISSYVGSITTHEPEKGLLFALWLAAGWWIGNAGLSRGHPENG